MILVGRQARGGVASASVADGETRGDGVEPRGETPARAVPVDPLPGAEKGLLREVFGFDAIPDFPQQEVEQPDFKQLDQLGEGFRRSMLRPDRELFGREGGERWSGLKLQRCFSCEVFSIAGSCFFAA